MEKEEVGSFGAKAKSTTEAEVCFRAIIWHETSPMGLLKAAKVKAGKALGVIDPLLPPWSVLGARLLIMSHF